MKRPAFYPSRAPIEVAAQQARPALQPPNMEVIGIIADSKVQLAMIKLPGTKDVTTLRLGSEVNGWTVVEVLADRVRLGAEQREFEVPLRSAGPKGDSQPREVTQTPIPKTSRAANNEHTIHKNNRDSR